MIITRVKVFSSTRIDLVEKQCNDFLNDDRTRDLVSIKHIIEDYKYDKLHYLWIIYTELAKNDS